MSRQANGGVLARVTHEPALQVWVTMLRRVFWFFLLGAIAFVVGALSLHAQQVPTNGPTVNMIVTVESRHGMNPPTVQPTEVLVYEDKTRDKVISWSSGQGDHAALELYILLDDSSGLGLGTQLDDIRQFINAQPGSTKIGVAYMQNGTAQLSQPPTADHAQAAKALRLPLGVAGMNGNPYFSLSDLVKRWSAGSDRREILMVSDGIDPYYGGGNTQDPYVGTAIRDAQKAGIVVYSIYSPGAGHLGHSYWRNYWGQIYLSQVSDETGGESYYVGFNSPAVAFAPYLDDMSHRFRNQYVLSFVAKPEKKEGMRSVRIASELSNIDLVAADQVFVPASE